ncbi:hypothetical protein [Streptomyces silvisoli]|uniref:Uncharacterized protein n=1 Tax=Streptomyces silvisoli TaxID=3034235 RepID=A0ABT5ZWA3_9ACTN|nr:hypothetical protein [Streptomyces silvisoli]MDF3294109.1 hypothetical protein [Streptomyces silvisoli]
MWVLPDRVRIATTAGQRAALELDVLAGRPAFRIPIGLWIAEFPDALQKMPKPRIRRSRQERPGPRHDLLTASAPPAGAGLSQCNARA